MKASSYKEFKEQYQATGPDQEQFKEDLQIAVQEDLTGRAFIYEMFSHELEQARYQPGDSLEKILNPLGLTSAKAHSTPPLFNGLKLAMEDYVDDLEADQEDNRQDN